MSITKIYDKIPKNHFVYHLMVLCFLGDLLVARYLYHRFTDVASLKEILSQVKNNEIDFSTLPPDYFQQILYIIHNTLLCMLGAMMIFHMVIYLLYYKGKVFTHLYLKALTWAGFVGSLWLGFASPNDPVGNWLFFIQGFLYLYGALGLTKHN